MAADGLTPLGVGALTDTRVDKFDAGINDI